VRQRPGRFRASRVLVADAAAGVSGFAPPKRGAPEGGAGTDPDEFPVFGAMIQLGKRLHDLMPHQSGGANSGSGSLPEGVTWGMRLLTGSAARSEDF
jgi:hypothetical protein